jgi:hypothetical protein
MSLQGIPSSVNSIGPAKLTPKETQASKNPENVIGGAEVRDDMEKLKDSHNSLTKSRAEQRANIIEANLKSGKEKTSQFLANALGKGVNPERMGTKEFGKVNNALKRMSERLRRGGSGRRSSETSSSQEELRQKNASTQAALSSRMKQLDNDDEDMDADSEGGSDLSGGGRDQESTIMMLKSMYGNEEAPKLEQIANDLPDNTLDNTTKSKVAKGLSNSEISPKSDESTSLVETLESEKFKSLEPSTKSTVTNFIEQNNPVDSTPQKVELPDPNKPVKTTIDDISITSTAKTSGNLTVATHNLKTSSNGIDLSVKLVSTIDSNGKEKMINDPLFGSSIRIKTKDKITIENFKAVVDKFSNFYQSTAISNMQEGYYVPNMGSVTSSLQQTSSIMLDADLDKPLNIRIPISFDESGNAISQLMQQKLDNAYMSEGGAYVFYEK